MQQKTWLLIVLLKDSIIGIFHLTEYSDRWPYLGLPLRSVVQVMDLRSDENCQKWDCKWVFPKILVPQNGWFIMENPIKMGDFGVPPFKETPKWCSDLVLLHQDKCKDVRMSALYLRESKCHLRKQATDFGFPHHSTAFTDSTWSGGFKIHRCRALVPDHHMHAKRTSWASSWHLFWELLWQKTCTTRMKLCATNPHKKIPTQPHPAPFIQVQEEGGATFAKQTNDSRGPVTIRQTK